MERRGDLLALEFTSVETKQLFCSATVTDRVQRVLEQVADSSRYFTLKITSPDGREAMIGFGFRDRDAATDLRESLQHFEAALRREHTAMEVAEAPAFTVPKLAEGEKIHVGPAGASRVVKKASSSGGAVPLLKKPPPAAQGKAEPMTFSMEGVNIEEARSEEVAGDDDSDGAVFEGDEDQWATEFKS